MNYFAHVRPLLADPLLAAGACVPDWLGVSDRGVRLRMRHLGEASLEASPRGSLLRGIRQHLRDDARFHATTAFAETMYRLAAASRRALGEEGGFRPSFLGHLLTELLLDASLIAAAPGELARFYTALEEVDPAWIAAEVNRVAPRPAVRLASFIELFRRERILSDYGDDVRLMTRLDQVMRRVGCQPLPPGFVSILPAARALVAERQAELLADIPTPEPPPIETS